MILTYAKTSRETTRKVTQSFQTRTKPTHKANQTYAPTAKSHTHLRRRWVIGEFSLQKRTRDM